MSDQTGRMTGFPQQQQQLMQPVFLPAPAASRQPLPKQLTAAIKSCVSLERLTQLFHAHQAVLNPIHIAAMITKLPKLDTSMHNAAVAAGADLPWVLSTASAQQVQLWQLLQQLLMRLKAQGCSEYSPRGVANIIWALAKLQCAPDPELRHMLLDKFCGELASAVPQDISNILWGVAKLTKERTAVLTNSTPMMGSAPGVLQTVGLAYSSPSTNSSPSLGGSGLSMQDWALAAVAPPGQPVDPSQGLRGKPLLAQDQVRLLLQHLCQQLHAASVQTISNSLWAVVVLQQEHQWCMCNCLAEVQALLSVFCKQPQQALPGHIQPVIRCMAQLATTCSNHAGDSWIKWQPPLLQQLLGYLCSQREHMEMHHVSSVLRDVAQVVCLHLLLAKQIRDGEQQPRTSRTGSGTEACPLRSSSSQIRADARGGSTAAAAVVVPSLNTIQAEDEAEEVLARLAATGGPQDASSTVVALAMLRPQLEQLHLQHGVAGLCSLLPAAALPHLGEEVGQRLLAAATSPSGASSATAAAKAGSNRLHVILPDDQQQQSHSGSLPSVVVSTPNAGPGSSSEGNSSSSNVESSSTAAAGGAVVVVSNPGLHPAGLGSSNVSVVSGDSSRSLGNPVPATSPTVAAAAAGLIQLTPLTPVGNPGPTAAAGHNPAGSGNPGSSTAADHGPGHNPGLNPNPPPPPPGDHPTGPLTTVDPPANPASAGPGFSGIVGLEPGSIAAGGPAVEIAAEDPPGMSIPGDTQEEAAARQLTHNIAYADSVYQLTEIFNAHSSVMDMIHITACITRLSKVIGTAPSASAQAAAAALLPLLGTKLLQVLPHANARGIANVLWGYGRLKNLLQSDLIPKLVEAFLQQMPGAACRDSAVVLWSLARLTEAHGLAHVGVQNDLLQRLGTAVLEQLAAAASSHQRQQQGGGSSSAAAAEGSTSSSEVPQTLSSRDVSNSLMALARLGFTPDMTQGTIAGDAKGSAAAGTTATSAIAAQLDVLSLDTPGEAAAAAASSKQQHQQQHGPGVASSEQPPPPPAAPAPAAGGLKRLTLPLKPIELLVQFLLQHAAAAKTLDLQEAATALKQLGLHDLHSQVTAAIVTPPPSNIPGAAYFAGQHAAMHYGHYGAGGLQYIHHHMAAGSSSGSASPMIARYGGSGPSSQGSAVAARPARPAGSSAVSVPGAINLSGTQLAGLLQQQRRQQPLLMSGPAYGAGWLGQQQQQLQRGQARPSQGPPSLLLQQQQRMMGGSSGRPGGPAAAGAGGAARSGQDMQQGLMQARRSQEEGYAAAGVRSRAPPYQPGFSGHAGLPGQSMQLQQYQRQQQQQRQLQLQMQGQQQYHQQQSVLTQQQQPGVQYMFVPQQQMQQGGYVLQQPQQQQQQQQDLLQLQLLQQQAQIQQQQQQQQQAAAGQLYVVPSSMAQYLNLGQQSAAAFGGVGGQQAGVTSAVSGAAQDTAYILQGGVQQQQQQPQQQMQVLPTLQVQSPLQGQGAGAYSVTSGLLMPQDLVQVDPQQQQQQQVQLYSMVGGAGTLPQLQQQQQGAQEPPGLYLQQQPQQQQQLVYQGGILDPATGYVQGGLLQGGQFQ